MLSLTTTARLTVREVAELARLGVGDSGPLGTSCSGFWPESKILLHQSIRERWLTLDDVYSDGADVPHRGVTGVLPGVHQPGLLDEEEGDGDLPLLCDLTDAPADGGVGDRLLVVIPEDELRRLRALLHQAGQVHGGTFVQEDFRAADYLGVGLWKQYLQSNISITQFHIKRLLSDSVRASAAATLYQKSSNTIIKLSIKPKW